MSLNGNGRSIAQLAGNPLAVVITRGLLIGGIAFAGWLGNQVWIKQEELVKLVTSEYHSQSLLEQRSMTNEARITALEARDAAIERSPGINYADADVKKLIEPFAVRLENLQRSVEDIRALVNNIDASNRAALRELGSRIDTIKTRGAGP